MEDEHLGSNLDEFLEEEGILAEAEAIAGKRVLAFQANPDSHLELQDELIMELQTSIDLRRQGKQETFAIEDVARELGLE